MDVLCHFQQYFNNISGVMVSELTSRVVDCGFRAKTCWLWIRIMCLSGAICISADCCFRELALWKSN